MDGVGISIREIITQVIKSDATAVVIAHNHPGGVALPSMEDVEATRMLKAALAAISVEILDHIVLGDEDYVSMAMSKQFSDIFGA